MSFDVPISIFYLLFSKNEDEIKISTWSAINFLTSSSVNELFGDLTTNAIGTSPASASGNLQKDCVKELNGLHE